MYQGVKTWSPFRGCRFACSYCVPSFQAQAKRQVHNCARCASFEPHEHPARLLSVPKAKILWPCANGDISFCDTGFIERIIVRLSSYNGTVYWQSKNPITLYRVTDLLKQYAIGGNHVMLTTLETNRDTGYKQISKAPLPSERALDFMALPWPRKIVTIEPIMDFDHDEFLHMICGIKPEAVYIGYNSHPKSAPLPEPSHDKTFSFIVCLEEKGIIVKTKYLPWEQQ
jgi:hypothetical protein